MAKTSIEREENKKGSKLLWVLFAFIPILVIIAAILIVSMVAGVNVFEKAKEVGGNIPVVSKFTGESSAKQIEKYESKIVELEGQVRDRETLISQLETKVENQEEQINELQLAKKQTEQSNEELEAMQAENKRAFKDIVRTYETMSAKRAAPILSEMKSEEALQILASIKADALADILEKMEPKEAARFTEMLATKRAGEN